MVTIRKAVPSDMREICRMVSSLLSVQYYRDDYTLDMAKIANTIANIVTSGGVIFVAESNGRVCGVVSATIIDAWFAKAHKDAEELFWWVDKEVRGSHHIWKALLVAIENWAKQAGCNTYNMSSSTNLPQDRMERIYRNLGYTKDDVIYKKVL